MFSLHEIYQSNLINAYHYLNSFEKSIQNLINNPQYPIPAELLAKLFNSMINDAGLLLKENEIKASSEINEINYLQKNKSNSNEIRKRIENINDKLKPYNDKVIEIIRYFRRLASLIRYIESSSIENVPYNIQHYFDRIIQSNKTKYYMFIRRQWKPNFKYAEFISQITSNKFFIPKKIKKNILKNINFKICMIAFPILEQENYLINCLLAHEVGHYLDEKINFSNELMKLKESDIEKNLPEKILNKLEDIENNVFKKEFEKEKNEIRAKEKAKEKVKEKKGNYIHWLLQVASIWSGQLIADIFATFMFGPAYPLALIEFLLPEFSLDEFFPEKAEGTTERSDPSLRMRLFFCLGALKYANVDFFSFFEKNKKIVWFNSIFEELKQIEKQIEDNSFPQFRDVEWHAKLIWEEIKKKYGQIYEPVFNHITENGNKINYICHPNKFTKEIIKGAEKKIKKFIPINEFIINEKKEIIDGKTRRYCETTPLEIDVILNFGWMEFLTIKKKYLTAESLEKKEDILKGNEILLKLIKRSIDASYFHTKYFKYKDILE